MPYGLATRRARLQNHSDRQNDEDRNYVLKRKLLIAASWYLNSVNVVLSVQTPRTVIRVVICNLLPVAAPNQTLLNSLFLCNRPIVRQLSASWIDRFFLVLISIILRSTQARYLLLQVCYGSRHTWLEPRMDTHTRTPPEIFLVAVSSAEEHRPHVH
jgi:hypothetical protein